MIDDIKNRIRDKVLKGLDYSENVSDEKLLDSIYNNINLEACSHFMPLQIRTELQKEIFNSIRGLDILEELLSDDSVTEIMVNGYEDIFVERAGVISKWEKRFDSHERLADIIQQIAAGANRIVNEASPIMDARLADGSRVHVVLPPVALTGPILTIRKFAREPFTMEKLVGIGALSKEAAGALDKLVRAGYNIFVSGGTGSGKTTFLNALADFIPQNERVITIEDSAELQIRNIPNLVRLEVRNRNTGECEEISIRDLIRASLRMRPDRIIVGEVRGVEITEMLQSMTTGHDGSLSTGHGNSIPDMLDRLETMTLMGLDIPLRAVRKQIASAIDIMIHLGRLRDGSRRVLEIAEVLGVSDGEIELNPLYVFKEEENCEEKDEKVVKGGLVNTGNSLVCRKKLRQAGIRWIDEKHG